MHLGWLDRLDWSQWHVWIAPVAGFLSAGFVLAGGRFLLARRRAVPTVTPATPQRLEPPDQSPNGSQKRRQSPRGNGHPTKVLLSDAEALAEPENGWVMNRSIGGLCLFVPRRYQAGMVLTVRPFQNRPDAAWVQLEVKHCRPQGEGYEIGCQFVRPPSWNLLMLFG